MQIIKNSNSFEMYWFKHYYNSFEGSNKYFSVSENGDVVLKHQLDYENEQHYELEVTMKGK